MHTPLDSQPSRPRRLPVWLRCVTTIVVLAVLVVVLAAHPAQAAALADPAPAPPSSLQDVIGRLRTFLVGMLVALATLFLTVAGVRYLAADGDPGEIERARKAFRSALIGYGIAALAPILVGILQSVVG